MAIQRAARPIQIAAAAIVMTVGRVDDIRPRADTLCGNSPLHLPSPRPVFSRKKPGLADKTSVNSAPAGAIGDCRRRNRAVTLVARCGWRPWAAKWGRVFLGVEFRRDRDDEEDGSRGGWCRCFLLAACARCVARCGAGAAQDGSGGRVGADGQPVHWHRRAGLCVRQRVSRRRHAAAGHDAAQPPIRSRPRGDAPPTPRAITIATTGMLGFSHTRLSGTGATDGGNFLVVPSVAPFSKDSHKLGLNARFAHDKEVAFPGLLRNRAGRAGGCGRADGDDARGSASLYVRRTARRPTFRFMPPACLAKGAAPKGEVRVLAEAREVEGSVRTFGTFSGAARRRQGVFRGAVRAAVRRVRYVARRHASPAAQAEAKGDDIGAEVILAPASKPGRDEGGHLVCQHRQRTREPERRGGARTISIKRWPRRCARGRRFWGGCASMAAPTCSGRSSIRRCFTRSPCPRRSPT